MQPHATHRSQFHHFRLHSHAIHCTWPSVVCTSHCHNGTDPRNMLHIISKTIYLSAMLHIIYYETKRNVTLSVNRETILLSISSYFDGFSIFFHGLIRSYAGTAVAERWLKLTMHRTNKNNNNNNNNNNKNSFCGTRYLSHCCSLHSTVVAVTWPWPCQRFRNFSQGSRRDYPSKMPVKFEVRTLSRFAAISI